MVPAKILIGVSLDATESAELLCWAVQVMAHPGDTVVALHIVGVTPNKKPAQGRKGNRVIKKEVAMTKQQRRIRQAKSHVISIVGELVKICQSYEVNLEARVGLHSCTGRGLVDEAKAMAADYLVVGGQRIGSKRSDSGNSFINNLWKKVSRITFSLLSTRAPPSVSKYCCEHVPKDCSLVVVRKSQELNNRLSESSLLLQDSDHRSSCRWSDKNSCNGNSSSSEENDIETLSSVKECKRPSPRTVLDLFEEDSQSNTDNDSLNSGESFSTLNTLLATDFKREETKKPASPFKRISSFFHLPTCNWSIRKLSEDSSRDQKQQPLLKCFGYQELATATNNFHLENMVGQGGYSEVYKGRTVDGCHIAVKRLAKDNMNTDKEKEFLMELGIIGHVNHPNTAKLLGFCIESGLYLVFRLYPNGTLSSALHGSTSQPLDWPTRYRISLGAARGLHYLHKCCKHRIIHRDIKASNVLLGPDYEPQISDFGLAKWLPTKWSHHAVIPIEGTFGYLAPEYFMHGIVDEKTDVFAFGILLLEILTGQPPVNSSSHHLLLWARPLMESGKLQELADPKMEGKYEMEEVYRVALTASYCVRQSSIWRPSMTEVLQLLTYDQDSDLAKSWRIPKFTNDEMDDYSMVFGYQLPSDLALDDI